ncbi:hypothetical protein NHH03_21260 [Stieleria sp. TO1_6]|uniref:hypothetical protein n=1 Tax=Stieleria tagensis TaxID=2956795 RepID=UPI00209BA391|nr:hypothetical protein [Stieleria tagensis]MCO8124285.1 hypothetical protein [Stieleria tagensis]
MAAVSCPSCDENVRLPTTSLPDHSSVQCPWCGDTFPSSRWLAGLAPLGQLIGPDGQPIQWDAPQRAETNDPDSLQNLAAVDNLPALDDVQHADEDESVFDGDDFDSQLADRDDPAADPIADVEAMVDANPPAETQSSADTEPPVDAQPSETEQPVNRVLDEIERLNNLPPTSPSSPGDEAIDLDEPQRNQSVDESSVILDDDEFPSGLGLAQPKNEDAENEWDVPEPWEMQESLTDMIAAGKVTPRASQREPEPSRSEVSRLDKQPLERPTVDQQPIYQRSQWSRRGSPLRNVLKIAAPSLLALPVAGAILLGSGMAPNLGFYPFDGSFSGRTAIVNGSDFQTPPALPDAANPDDDLFAASADSAPSQGRVLVGSDAQLDSDSADSTDSYAAQFTNQLADAGGDAGSTDEASSDEPPATESPLSPSEIGDLFAPREQEQVAKADVADPDTSSVAEVDTTSVAVADADADADATPAVVDPTVAAAPQTMQTDVTDSLLVFPAEPPSLDSVVQASAETEIKPAEKLPELPAAEEHSIDSIEVVEACNLALASLERFESISNSDKPQDKKQLAQLAAYRDVATIGGLSFEPDSPNVNRILARLSQLPQLESFGQMSAGWIRYQRRGTDGILLVGQIRHDNGVPVFELPDSIALDLTLATQIQLPDGQPLVAFGRILPGTDKSADAAPQIELSAGVVAD